ncbi:hypothetical protein OFO16_20015 [Vibrio natriegens]|nr:hypothetical protein [Vibrio natriegens]UYI48702.1 hypothetical protein OFO16_20015 [Vibrio natriegens]
MNAIAYDITDVEQGRECNQRCTIGESSVKSDAKSKGKRYAVDRFRRKVVPSTMDRGPKKQHCAD